MHDTLQGVAGYVLCNTLQFAKNEFGLTVASWNNAIAKFIKSADALEKHRNLPVPNFGHNFTCNQTASQYRTLITRFAFISHLVEPKLPNAFYATENFQVFSRFSKIISYLNSPLLHRNDMFVMENLIENFLKSYAKLYGASEMKNKHHHLIHYPTSMMSYGPAFHNNTMIHERTLRKIKPMIRGRKGKLFSIIEIYFFNTSYFQGIIKQIAVAASFQSFWFLESMTLKNDRLFVGQAIGSLRNSKSRSSISKNFSSLPMAVTQQIPDNAILHKNIRHLGALFFQNGVVCEEKAESGWLDGNLNLSEVISIFSIDQKLYLVLKKLIFIRFRPDFIGVEVERDAKETLRILPVACLSPCRCFSMKTCKIKSDSASCNAAKHVNIAILDALPYKLYF